MSWMNPRGWSWQKYSSGPTGFKDTNKQNFPWTWMFQDLILKRQSNSGLGRFPQILSGSIFKRVWRRNILASGYPFVWLSAHYFICNTLTFIIVGEQWSARCLPVCFSGARLLARVTPFIYLVARECLIYPSCSSECLGTTCPEDLTKHWQRRTRERLTWIKRCMLSFCKCFSKMKNISGGSPKIYNLQKK